ncbi:MAG: heme exporter protein CcmB [Deltaproteobacteria bacterium]|nr:heme exporter protein CcmB [Deltaproteobacteria bacterium]
MSMFHQVWAIVWKDLMIDLRRKENILSMFFFSLLTLLVFTFAAGSLQDTRYRLTPQGLKNLTADGLNPSRQRQLDLLVDRTYPGQGDFLAALKAAGGEDWTDLERTLIVAAAKGNYMQDVAPGLFWVTFLLAGVLGLDKSFNQEKENGCMDGLLMTPVGGGVIYLGKMTSNVLFLMMIMTLLLPLFALFFKLDLWPVAGPVVGVSLLGVAGITTLGTLLGGVVSSLRGKEVLFPLLLFPLLVPILIGVVHLTGVILTGQPMEENWRWVQLVGGFDLVFLIVSYMVFDHVMEA